MQCSNADLIITTASTQVTLRHPLDSGGPQKTRATHKHKHRMSAYHQPLLLQLESLHHTSKTVRCQLIKACVYCFKHHNTWLAKRAPQPSGVHIFPSYKNLFGSPAHKYANDWIACMCAYPRGHDHAYVCIYVQA
jgi:hypothetical protein